MSGLAAPTGRTRPDAGAPDAPTRSYRAAVEELAGVTARAALEVLAGRRRLRQLLRLVSPAVYDRLQARLPDPRERRRAPTPATVHRVLAAWPTPRACEATVLVERGDHVTALAVRIERYEGSWRVVEIAAPEEGLAPTSTRSTHRGPRPPPR